MLLIEGLKVSPQFFFPTFILILLIYTFTITSNICLVVLIFSSRSLHQPMYLLFCNLSINDLIGATVIVPSLLRDLLLSAHSEHQYIHYISCVTQAFGSHMYAGASHTVLMIMAFDRYVAICSPLRYSTIMTNRMVVTLSLAAWGTILVLVSILLGLTIRLSRCRSVISNPFCDNASIFKLSCESLLINQIYGLGYTVVLLGSSIGSVMLTYLKIAAVCLQSKNKALNSKALQTCATHLTVYVLLLGSGFMIVILHRFPQLANQRKMVTIQRVVVLPALNAVIYGLQIKEIKQRIVALFMMEVTPQSSSPAFILLLFMYIFIMVSNLGLLSCESLLIDQIYDLGYTVVLLGSSIGSVMLTYLKIAALSDHRKVVTVMGHVALPTLNAVIYGLQIKERKGRNAVTGFSAILPCLTAKAIPGSSAASPAGSKQPTSRGSAVSSRPTPVVAAAPATEPESPTAADMGNQTIRDDMLLIEGLKVSSHFFFPTFILILIIYTFTITSNICLVVLIFSSRSLHQPMSVISHPFCDNASIFKLSCESLLINQIYGLGYTVVLLGSSIGSVMLTYLKIAAVCLQSFIIVILHRFPQLTNQKKMVAIQRVVVLPALNAVIYGLQIKEIKQRIVALFYMRNQTVSDDMLLIEGLKVSSHFFFPTFILILIIYTFTITSNICLVVLIFSSRSLHQPMYLLFCNLSINDLIGATVIVPSLLRDLLLSAHLEHRYIHYISCVTQAFGMHMYAGASHTVLMIMAFDRYVAICSPLRYSTIMTNRMVVTLSLAAWGTILVLVSILLGLTIRLSRCRSVISHPYCDNASIFKLSCESLLINQIYGLGYTVVLLGSSIGSVMLTYLKIAAVCLQSKNKALNSKALQTCATHLTVSVISNPFCDNASLFKLSCESVLINQIYGLSYTVMLLGSSMGSVMLTYLKIAAVCLRSKNKALNSKALQTCTTHLTVYILLIVSGFIIIIMHRFPQLSDHRK
ncbi:hypothetical protein INR49_030227, partial [Caranx melampygus]